MRPPTQWPWWVQVITVHLLARALNAAVFAVVAGTQAANPWTGPAPSYLEYTSAMWDADWYRQIAELGYPAGLPAGSDGGVVQNPWAFFPLMPGLARLLAAVGVDWQVAAPALALAAGAGAMLVIHQLVAGLPDVADHDRTRLPLATVAVATTFVSAPVLQVAYSESLALLLLASVLLCLQRRAYLTAVPLVLALGLTRAIAIPVVVVVVVHAWIRWRAARRGQEAITSGQWWSLTALAAASALAAVAWPVVVAVSTGQPDAFAQTQAAWRAHASVIPLVPWVDVPQWFFGRVGILVLPTVIVAAVLICSGRTARALGDMRTWVVAYVAYLLLATEPGTSQLRFLLLAFPLAVVPAAWALRRQRWRLALAVVAAIGLVSQVAWIALVWRLVPPSGWPP